MFLQILNSESITFTNFWTHQNFVDQSEIPSRIPSSVRILSRKLLNSSIGHIFSNSEFLWRFFNSRNFEIGILTRIPFFIEKAAEFNLFFHIFSSFGTFHHGWSRRFHPFSWTRDHRKVCYTIQKKWLYISFAVSYFY